MQQAPPEQQQVAEGQRTQQQQQEGADALDERMAAAISGEALRNLMAAEGLLGWAKFHNGLQLFAMRQARRLIAAAGGEAAAA